MNLNNASIYNNSLGHRVTREEDAKRSGFYVSSFKQLNSMQSKQVGLIMGACVADAALRGLEELGAADISKMIDRNDAYETSVLREAMKEAAAKAGAPATTDNTSSDLPTYASYDPVKKPNGFSLLDPCIFSRGVKSTRKLNRLDKARAEEASLAHEQSLLDSNVVSPALRDEWVSTRATHSYTYLFFKEYLRAVATHHHAVGLSKVQQQWTAIEKLFPEDHSVWHGSAPHAVGALAAVPSNYPWAADEGLRDYSMSFVDFLTTNQLVPAEEQKQQGSSLEGGSAEEAPAAAIFDPNAVPQALSVLALPLRCLAHNPDPVRNTALMGMPQSRDAFPASHSSLVAGATMIEGAVDEEMMTADITTAPSSSSREALGAAVLHHQQVLRTALHIVDKARTYTEGVLMCSRAATHVYRNAAVVGASGAVGATAAAAAAAAPMGAFAMGPLGLLVGAALGAKFAIKSIPAEWLGATRDHEVVASQAIQLAEWSWNTPSRLRK